MLRTGLSRRGKNFSFFLLVFSLLTVIMPPAKAADQRILDVVELTWNSAPRPSVSVNDVRNSIEKARSSWLTFTTLEGADDSKSIEFVYGRGINESLRLLAPFQCEATGFTSFVNAIRSEFYKRAGIADPEDRYLIILVPNAGCIWSGRALIGNIKDKSGGMVLHNTASAFVITHELGHALGLGHTNLLRCASGAKDGAWSDDCKAIEYGGSIDVMGNVDTTSGLSVYHQWRIGLLEQSEIHQSWLSETVTLNASDRKSGTRAIFIKDGNSSYWLEYRRPKSDLSYKSGIVIYRSDPPPTKFIESPNPLDDHMEQPGPGISIDTWMLNLDSYSYLPTGRAFGSMSLPESVPVTLHSNNVKISFTRASDSNSVRVVIDRKPDLTAPPKPTLSPSQFWQFPDFSVLADGYEDAGSQIDYFEIKRNEEVVKLTPNFEKEFAPTFLSPFNEKPTLRIKDLPEGRYDLQVRSVDVWGNKSEWSDVRRTFIDRGAPNISANYRITSASPESAKISLTDFRDLGSGLCETVLINPEGFVVARSTAASAPEIEMDKLAISANKLQSFDCLGNGRTASVKASYEFLPTSEIRKVSKWRTLPGNPQAITCAGSCIANLTSSGTIQLAVGSGSANISVARKELARIEANSSNAIRLSDPIKIGPNKRTVRIEGKNLVIYGAARVGFELGPIANITRVSHPEDISLKEAKQQELANYGFRATDFEQGWFVLPMSGGTTLNDPTLDLCKPKYESDQGRELRRQIAVTKVGNPYLFLSSEVVRYKSESAAKVAYEELIATARKCLTDGGGLEQGDVFTKYAFRSIPGSTEPFIVRPDGFFVSAVIGEGASARSLLAFYQFKGSVFSGLYVVTLGSESLSREQIERWRNVATLFLQRMG